MAHSWLSWHMALAGAALAGQALHAAEAETSGALSSQAAVSARDAVSTLPGKAAAVEPASSRFEFLPMEATVNGAKAGAWLFARRDGAIFAPQEVLAEWRLSPLPHAVTVDIRCNPYIALSAVPGYRAQVDTQNQILALTFSPQAFVLTTLASERRPGFVPDPAIPGVFLNYDVSLSRTALRAAPSVDNLGLLGEVGVSSAAGLLTTSFSGLNLTGSTAQAQDQSPRWRRLESTFVRHLPDSGHTLRLGDSSTRAGLLGRQFYFAGAQFGTNFSLNPGFVTQPQPLLGGVSSAPSTVELYVNDVLRQVSNVPTGPFALNNLPVFTGGGEARLVVRDLLGRETVVVQPFFVSPRLLAPGLADWSLSGGRLRKSLGTARSTYDDAFVSGDARWGASPSLTLEGRAEVSAARRYASLGVVTTLPSRLLGQAAWAASSDRDVGNGHQWLLGFESQGLRSSAALQAQGATARMRYLGQDTPATRWQLAGTTTFQHETLGTFGMGFARIDSFATPERVAQRITTLTGNYGLRLPGRTSLSVNVSRAMAGDRRTSLSIMWVIPLDSGLISTASAQLRGSQHDLLLTAARSQDAEQPLGWRLLAGQQQDSARLEGGLHHRGRFGQVSADLSTTHDITATRLNASGALVAVPGGVFAAQRSEGSYALVELAGHGGVGVGLGNAAPARTDASGLALVPNLVPYQRNFIRLEASEVPLSAELDSIERTVVPGARSIVKVVFPVRSGRAAVLKILLEDGQPAPPGATLRIDGDSQVFYVGRRGEAFLSGLAAKNRVRLQWEQKQCLVDIALPANSADEILRLAPVTCQGGQ